MSDGRASPRLTSVELPTRRLPLASSRCVLKLKPLRNIPKCPPCHQHHRRVPKGDDAAVPRQHQGLGHLVRRQMRGEYRHSSLHTASGQPAQFRAVRIVRGATVEAN